MKKIITHFTHVAYLDTAIEHIKTASNNGYDLHVLIALTPQGLKSNILNLEIDIDSYPPLVSFESIKNDWNLGYLEPYFEKCKSVHFVVYSPKLSLNSISNKIKKFINGISPDFIHLDGFVSRQYPLILFLLKHRNKLILNVHDPKMHSGEFEIKRYIITKFLLKLVTKFVVFANDSKEVLGEQLSKNKKIFLLRLRPSSIYKELSKITDFIVEPTKISFVGRLSKYKGIDLFIEAINGVHKTNPSQEFIIAGKPFKDFEINYDIIKNKNKVSIMEKFLSNEEITEIIMNSKLIVCPYIDATQSGVILIAHGLNRPVLVTPVGGLPDYIIEGKNGLVAENVSAESLTKSINGFIDNNLFESMKKDFHSEKSINSLVKHYVAVLDIIYS
ncbi:glycosyltransferase family 4 protein [Maribacter sp. IgM3_T14_3]|uniref:glycosyltransferase family 4 protein n=1 Tax=Maribacter sp. IgM3_T14_3 TaxID=3415140 RepID=UPI003C70336D